MPLFIDRLQLREVSVNYGNRNFVTWYPLLPFVTSEVDCEYPPEHSLCRLWKYDTGNSFDAFAWQFHLRRCGLHPIAPHRMSQNTVTVVVANGNQIAMPLRTATLWLVSNIPHLRSKPLRLPLHRGLPFVNAPYPTPSTVGTVFPLVGIRLFRRAGLRVQINHDDLTLSVWTRDEEWYTTPARYLRRISERFERLDLEELCEDDWA